MVTFNGRITLPAQVRKDLGLKTGDNVDFVEVEKGRFAICHRSAAADQPNRSNPKSSRDSEVEESGATLVQ
jgi:AbrB family looped-hinge helix DNA binding protein